MSDRSRLDELAALMAGAEYIDLSPVISTNMPRWPTHPDVEIRHDARTFVEHGYYAQNLLLPEHSGCHVDAPVHLLADGRSIDHFPLDALIGPAKKVDVTGVGLGPGEALSFPVFQQLLASASLTVESGDIVLFEFGWDRHFDAERTNPGGIGWWGTNEPGLDEDSCRFLFESEVKAAGSDTAGCDIAARDGVIFSAPGHETWFLPRGLPIIEGLYGLAAVPTEFFFLALPLRIEGGSGSPLRAVGLLPN